MLIDCALIGSERRIELHVPDVEKAWPFYRDILGAQEAFRSESRASVPARISFSLNGACFTLLSARLAESGDSRSTLNVLAEDFGAAFVAIILYVRDPVAARLNALNAGSRLQPEAASGTPTFGGHPVEVIIDPYGNSWAFAKL
jgi:hypothetical protein